MITSLKAVRVSPDVAASLTVARLDHSLSEVIVDEDLPVDPQLPDPMLDEIVRTAVAEAEAAARIRGFEAGLSEGRDQMIREVREELERETTEIREELRKVHEDERAAQLAEHREVQGRMQAAIETLNGAVASFEAAVIPRYEEVGRDLAGVVLALVEDLVGRELATDGAHVVQVITRALAEIPSRADVTVAMHPDDLELLARFDIDLETALGRPVTVVSDESVDRHGAILTSGCTQVDAQIRSSLDRLREALAS